MTRGFFRRHFTRLENTVTGIAKSDRNFTRTHILGLKREMINELPNKVNEAREGFDTVGQISNRRPWTDDDVNNVIREAQRIKGFYQKYQVLLNINNSRYNELTGPFTRQRNAWQRGNPGQRMANNLGGKVIEEGKNFLAEAVIDLQSRLTVQQWQENFAANISPDGSGSLVSELADQIRPHETHYPPDSSTSPWPPGESNIATNEDLRRVEDLRGRVNELPEDISELKEYHNELLNDIIGAYNSINERYHQEISDLNALTHNFILKMQDIIPPEIMDNLQSLFTQSINKVGMTETDDNSPNS